MNRIALLLLAMHALPTMAQDAVDSTSDDFWLMSTPKTPIPPVTEADRAAAFPALMQMHEHDHSTAWQSMVLIERLEVWDAEPGAGQAWEGKAWIGSDINRLWLRSAGEREAGHTEAADFELLYGRAVSPWWDVVAGVRRDAAVKTAGTQDFLALGFIGLAPYKFEVEATAYLGQGGQHGLHVAAEYESLITGRWILQPVMEADFYGKPDPQRGLGRGLNSLEAGLRLRYEVTRQFAPYIGWGVVRYFGETAQWRQLADEPTQQSQLVFGIRTWF